MALVANVLGFVGLATGAAGHAMLTKPVSRNKGALDLSGCTFAPNDPTGPLTPAMAECQGSMSWFCGSNLAPVSCTTLPGPAITISEEMRTSPKGHPPSHNFGPVTPWEAPGSSMPVSACGTAVNNQDGRNLPKSNPIETWTTGSIQQVGWSIWANHGGGYAWRLCPASDDINQITEECFQKMPLDFADDYSTLEWVNDSMPQLKIDAKTTSQGTIPAGSQWRRNPIPSTEFCFNGCDCPPTWQGKPGFCPAFDPPCTDCWGSESPGPSAGSRHAHQDFSILDNIKVPAGIKPGAYLLQWRWDAELGNNQVWTNCADVEIVAGESTSLAPSMLV